MHQNPAKTAEIVSRRFSVVGTRIHLHSVRVGDSLLSNGYIIFIDINHLVSDGTLDISSGLKYIYDSMMCMIWLQ